LKSVFQDAWVYDSFVASWRVAQRDRGIVKLYQQHFDLSKTRSATTDYILLEKQQWMSIIAEIVLLTTYIV